MLGLFKKYRFSKSVRLQAQAGDPAWDWTAAPANKNFRGGISRVSTSTKVARDRAPTRTAAPHGKTLGKRIAENWQLYLLLLIPVVITIIYKYIPMYG